MGAAAARRLHIADLQTGADVQMAGAFWDGFSFFFFLLPPQQSLSHSSQDRSFLLASSIVGHLSFLSQRWSEETGRCFLPPPSDGRTTSMSRWRKRHSPITCYTPAARQLLGGGRPRKMAHARSSVSFCERSRSYYKVKMKSLIPGSAL